MKCEHAQEFFSDYIEQSLDKPALVALEAHLTACATCRRDVEGLGQTWDALRAVPAVEPPRDLAWRVLVQLQRERLERLEAERRRPNPFVAWLHSLTPGAAFGYATLVALLFIAIAFPLRGLIPQVKFTPEIPGWSPPAPSVGIGRPADPGTVSTGKPLASIVGAYQDAQNGQWFYRLFVTAPPGMGDGIAIVSPAVVVSGQLSGTTEMRRRLIANQPVLIPVPTAVAGERVQAVFLRVVATGSSPFYKVINVPGP